MQTYQMNRDRDQLRRDLAAMTEERDERTVERDSERRRAAYAEGLLSKTLRRLERVKEEREELRGGGEGMSQFDSAMDMVFHEIRKERERQIAKWGVQRHDDFRWLAIFQEELGEVCQAILQERHDDACQELIQSAAVLVAWLEHIFMTMEGE